MYRRSSTSGRVRYTNEQYDRNLRQSILGRDQVSDFDAGGKADGSDIGQLDCVSVLTGLCIWSQKIEWFRGEFGSCQLRIIKVSSIISDCCTCSLYF